MTRSCVTVLFGALGLVGFGAACSSDEGAPADVPGVVSGGAAGSGGTAHQGGSTVGGTSMGGSSGSGGSAGAGASSGGASGGSGGAAVGGAGGSAAGGTGGAPMPSDCVTVDAMPAGDTWTDSTGTATLTIADRDSCERTYVLSTTADLRDGEPSNPRTFVEQVGDPTVRSGHDLFDALHALALEEARELSVSSISDFAFNDGQGVPCPDGGCFETGRKWNYVWTRDTAYAVDLGLAPIDPTRARNSLEFKLSAQRGGVGEQIVQDTGSGGSYPVSSDRVSWAVGAWTLLSHLEGTDRTAFRDRAYAALKNTLEHDRVVVFDSHDGLYRGEQSFLDWREQSYPEWTADTVVHIGESKALSTNLLHLRALEVAGALAEEMGDTSARDRYQGWAGDLRTEIRETFWVEEAGLFSTYVTTHLDSAPVRRYDLLGSAFAVLFGVATQTQAERVLESYPHYGPGAVVVWPQQQDTRIYHNRGEWPFVTAYWLRAAKAAGNDAIATRMVRALMRGAALNLSNMENFEAATGLAYKGDEGEFSGPVVNSQRQLWSVAGYLSMVHHTLFGLEAEPAGLRVRPMLTAALRSDLFGGSDEIVLNHYPYRGKRLTIVLHLPAAEGSGTHAVKEIRLDGSVVSGDLIGFDALSDGSRIDVELEAAAASASLTEVDDSDWQQVFGPRTPRISGITNSGGNPLLALDLNGAAAGDVTWTLYRDGVQVATGLPGGTTTWTDSDMDAASERSPCYSAELTFSSSGNHSQHAPAYCWWGDGFSRIQTIAAGEMTALGGSFSNDHGRAHWGSWGDAGHTLSATFGAGQSGEHLIQVVYGNGAGGVDTGITCGHKRVTVYDASTDTEVATGFAVMPHLGNDNWARWGDSSFVRAQLEAGKSYRVVLSGDAQSINMSAFKHFETYGGSGGKDGQFERVNVAEIKILAR